MKFTAAVTERKGAPFTLQELELGELRADEVLVRVAAAGICHTDLIIRDQWYPVPLPAVLGHEGAGTVERVGSAVSGVAAGRPRRHDLRLVRRLRDVPERPAGVLPRLLRAQLRVDRGATARAPSHGTVS